MSRSSNAATALFGVKAGSLIGHENDLGVSSAKAGIKLQEWFVRRRREFSDQT